MLVGVVAIGVAYIRDGAAIRSAGGGRPDDETSAMDGGHRLCLPAICLGFLNEKSVTEEQNYHQRLSESHSFDV